MPRVEFKLADRVYILKLICTAQMTYSSFISILYLYLIILGIWTSNEDTRPGVSGYKWTVIVVTMIDFGMGTLLAFAANMRGLSCRRRIVVWIMMESVYIPTSIFLLMRLYYKIQSSSKRLPSDPHYTRTNLAQVCFICCHFFFIAYVLDFLVQKRKKPKTYDPSIRPESVYAPTDPQITTTESRHIRMSQSFLFQPSTSKGLPATLDAEEAEEETNDTQSQGTRESQQSDTK